MIYAIKDELNLERFRRRATKEGYVEGSLVFSPPGTSETKNCPSFITKSDPYSQATLYGNELYVYLDKDGNPLDITKLLDEFKFE